jgi:hypothetical protein
MTNKQLFRGSLTALVITLDNLTALRDLLNQVIQTPDIPTPPAGGSIRH